MAYSPIEQAITASARTRTIAERRGVSPAQVAPAWLPIGNVVVIPSSNPNRIRENRASPDLALTEEEVAELDRVFPHREVPSLETQISNLSTISRPNGAKKPFHKFPSTFVILLGCVPASNSALASWRICKRRWVQGPLYLAAILRITRAGS